MSRTLAAGVVAAVLVALAPTAAPAAPLAPETLTLRLPDLGPNYELGSSRCDERSRAEEQWWPSTLPSLSERFPHRGCVIAFGKSWSAPGIASPPGYIMSAAFSFADAAGPTAALQRPRAIALHVLDPAGPPVTPPVPRGVAVHRPDANRRADLHPLNVDVALGDDVRAFRFSGYEPGTVLLWRSGAVLALVLAAGPADDRTTQAAIRLATAQQARIATPMPLLPPDLDDVEVPLENPRLGVPVAWLGRELPSAGSRPTLSLISVDGPQHSRFDPRAALYYGSQDPRAYVDLSLWRPRLLRRSVRRLRGFARHICAHRYDASADGIHATVFAYRVPPSRKCGSRPFNGFQAFAFLPDVAVTLEAVRCSRCRVRSRYASVAGMRFASARLRHRPTSAGARPAQPAAASAPTAAPAASACRASPHGRG